MNVIMNVFSVRRFELREDYEKRIGRIISAHLSSRYLGRLRRQFLRHPRSLAMIIDDAQNSKLRSPIVRSVHHFLVYIIDYLSNFSVDKIEQFFRIETFRCEKFRY